MRKKYGFAVILKRKTPNKEASKLMQDIFKNKYVRWIEARMIIDLKNTEDVKILRKKK